jgi:AcrR family transcriptional regulator
MSDPDQGTKRADARRNIESIVSAAMRLLAADPDATMQQIADAAGVGRVTIYAHFSSRTALVAEVAKRAIARTDADLAALNLGGEAIPALTSLLEATWRLAHRHGAILTAADRGMDATTLHHAHASPERRFHSILERGRASGVFRIDMPIAWQLDVIHAVLHGASDAVHRGALDADDAPRLLVTTILAALATPATG